MLLTSENLLLLLLTPVEQHSSVKEQDGHGLEFYTPIKRSQEFSVEGHETPTFDIKTTLL